MNGLDWNGPHLVQISLSWPGNTIHLTVLLKPHPAVLNTPRNGDYLGFAWKDFGSRGVLQG